MRRTQPAKVVRGCVYYAAPRDLVGWKAHTHVGSVAFSLRVRFLKASGDDRSSYKIKIKTLLHNYSLLFF